MIMGLIDRINQVVDQRDLSGDQRNELDVLHDKVQRSKHTATHKKYEYEDVAYNYNVHNDKLEKIKQATRQPTTQDVHVRPEWHRQVS